MKMFFLEKHSIFFIFSNFSHVQNFLTFCWKNLIIRVEMLFIWKNTSWYAFFSKFATFRCFEKIQVFFAKPVHFFKKDRIFERFEKSYYFSHILRQICYSVDKK